MAGRFFDPEGISPSRALTDWPCINNDLARNSRSAALTHRGLRGNIRLGAISLEVDCSVEARTQFIKSLDDRVTRIMEERRNFEEFSLLGGPLHRLGKRLGLVHEGRNTFPLRLALGVFSWC
jgi:hypothetical protein